MRGEGLGDLATLAFRNVDVPSGRTGRTARFRLRLLGLVGAALGLPGLFLHLLGVGLVGAPLGLAGLFLHLLGVGLVGAPLGLAGLFLHLFGAAGRAFRALLLSLSWLCLFLHLGRCTCPCTAPTALARLGLVRRLLLLLGIGSRSERQQGRDRHAAHQQSSHASSSFGPYGGLRFHAVTGSRGEAPVAAEPQLPNNCLECGNSCPLVLELSKNERE